MALAAALVVLTMVAAAEGEVEGGAARAVRPCGVMPRGGG